MVGRIVGLILTTFFLAIIYGLFVTTMDFMAPDYDPVASGRYAADRVYALFGVVGDEIKRNDSQATIRTSATYKAAMPYAITADLAAILGGKLEVGVSSFFHAAANRASSRNS